MNGFTPDRKPQQMARMLAMQERNLSLNSPGNNMRNVPQPNLMYSGGMMQRPRMPAPAGMTTPQGGSYRGDFENG
jgi:hypothetical protein